MRNLKDLLESCDNHVRLGAGHQVAKALSSLNTAAVPRELRLPFANVCRRSGLINLAMRLLTPIVYPDRNKWRTQANDAELAEYAVLLQKSGVISEALSILEKIDVEAVPEALLYRSFCRFAHWNYEHSIEDLHRYIDRTENYQKLVGQANLASALLLTHKLDESKQLISEIISSARKGTYSRLLGNCLEMRAQIAIREMKLNQAEDDLNDAARQLQADQTTDELFIRKWRAVVQSLRQGTSRKLQEFRQEAVRRSHWESVREADFYLLKVSFRTELFHHLLFGTPFQSYRERLHSDFGMTAPSTYVLGGGERRLELSSGKFSDNTPLRPGSKIHHLLVILLRDFYRPQRLGGLFSELFPNERFDVYTSDDRVHQVLRRARRWIAENQIPARIVEDNGFYTLRAESSLSIVIDYDLSPITPHQSAFQKLRKEFRSACAFTARTARERLGLPLTSCNRLLVWAEKENLITRKQSGPATYYVLN